MPKVDLYWYKLNDWLLLSFSSVSLFRIKPFSVAYFNRFIINFPSNNTPVTLALLSPTCNELE